MKIMFSIGTLSSGGAERVVCNLSNYLNKFHDIHIVSVKKTDIAYTLDSNISIDFLDNREEISYDKLMNKRILDKIRRIIRNLRRIRKLKKIIKKNKPEIIVSFLPEPNFLNLILKSKFKIPIIISVRNDPKEEYKSNLYNRLMKKYYPQADAIVYQTEEAKNFFRNIIGNNVIQEIIPNPINEEFIGRPYKGIRKKIIVTVGRLQEQKNHKLLIDAFEKVSNQIPDYKLVIYGDGNKKQELETYIKSKNLLDKVMLAGNTKEVKKHIYDASLFILSSDYEGMPNALMEAMALGLPVISTDCPCGGPKFLIDNEKNGILVKVKDVEAMSKAILTVLENKNYADYLSMNASKIAETLNPTKINNEWKKIIEKIGKNK